MNEQEADIRRGTDGRGGIRGVDLMMYSSHTCCFTSSFVFYSSMYLQL